MLDVNEICWTRSAVRDLDEILEYIAADRGIDRALQLYETLRHRIASLTTMPHQCRLVPELKDIGLLEHREIIESPYRLIFRVTGHRVAILAVLDSRRDLTELLIQRAVEG